MNNKRNGGNPKIMQGGNGASAMGRMNQDGKGNSNGFVAKKPIANGAA